MFIWKLLEVIYIVQLSKRDCKSHLPTLFITLLLYFSLGFYLVKVLYSKYNDRNHILYFHLELQLLH